MPEARTLLSIGVVLGGMAVSIGLAEASWRLIEQPAQQLKKKLSKARRDESAGVPVREHGERPGFISAVAGLDAAADLNPEI